MAIGCDQGGSIRVPASFCGVVGMKPTHGLVPYTGILSLDPTIDHAGPITRTVAENALLLQAIAGPDGLDPRQAEVRVGDYAGALGDGAEGLRIGVLREGFSQPGSEPDVDAGVRAAAERFARLGAKVEEVSVAVHRTSQALAFPVLQSAAFLLFQADGCALGHEELGVPGLADRMRAWRERPDALPDTVKLLLLGTELLRRRHGFRYWAKSMNFVRQARRAYDEALARVDLLCLPTTPMKATPLPPPGAPREAVIQAAFSSTPNTMIFDHTHHPALSLPCGESEGLPIGMMLVGRRFEEALIYRAAHAFEQASGVTGSGKAAKRPHSERKRSAQRAAGERSSLDRPSGVRAPAKGAAKRPHSERKRSAQRAAGERSSLDRPSGVTESGRPPRRSPRRRDRGTPRKRPRRSSGSRRS
jgi:amidase